MHAWHDVQRAFGAALADVGCAAAATEHLRGAAPQALTRLAVYRGNVYGNYLKALSGSYPITRAIVGEEFFEGMAREYARQYPSTCGDLNAYGGMLADFVENFPPAGDLPYLPDVARMEWLAHRAYYAADGIPFDAARLMRTPQEEQERLRPVLASACALFKSSWPLKRLWEIHQDDYIGEFEIDLDSGPDRILIHRPEWQVRVDSLTRGDFRFLSGAMNGETLCEALAAAMEQGTGFDPGYALVHWVRVGVIVDLASDARTI